MITEVDEALRRLVQGAEIGGATVTLDRPDGARPPAAVIALHLRGLTEELGLRANDWEDVRDDDGQVQERRPHPRWYRLEYEVTAWAKGASDEHRLLDAVLRRLVLHDVVPADHLTGSLSELGLDVSLSTGLARTTPWIAAPSRRPVLEVTVLAPLRPDLSVPVAPPASTSILSLGRPGVAAEKVATSPGDAALRREAVAPPPPPAAPTGMRRTRSRG
jgi:Pvc16 N-terminal domain